MPNFFYQRSPYGPGALFPGIGYTPTPPFSLLQNHPLSQRVEQQSGTKTYRSLKEADRAGSGATGTASPAASVGALLSPSTAGQGPGPGPGPGRRSPWGWRRRSRLRPAAPAEPLPLTLPCTPSRSCAARSRFCTARLKVYRPVPSQDGNAM